MPTQAFQGASGKIAGDSAQPGKFYPAETLFRMLDRGFAALRLVEHEWRERDKFVA